jgi:hypothetical protein
MWRVRPLRFPRTAGVVFGGADNAVVLIYGKAPIANSLLQGVVRLVDEALFGASAINRSYLRRT